MKNKIKNANPQQPTVDAGSDKQMKGNSIDENSMKTLKKQKSSALAESPVEKENKK